MGARQNDKSANKITHKQQNFDNSFHDEYEKKSQKNLPPKANEKSKIIDGKMKTQEKKEEKFIPNNVKKKTKNIFEDGSSSSES